uniref:C2H2-type domain-containing protein n=1 Tax=Stegastes partitus TaxID=144197 RepID=A0A3B4ZF85_9TELE
MKPLRCPNNETKAEHKNEARDTPSALTSEQYCKVSETLNRKTVIQKFACREGLSQHMFHTEIQMEVKQEKPETTDIKEEQTELELTGLKEEQQDTDTAECIFSSVPLKTEDDEEKPQSSKLHHRHSVEKPHPVSQPDNEMSDPSETDVSDGDWEETSEAWSDLNGPVVPLSCNDQKSFVCPVCGKIFGRKGNLETHLRTHTGERPFSCHLCNKTFTTKLIMKMHMSVHTGEKRFTCHVCGKKFNWHSQIKYHKCVQNQTAEAELHLGTTEDGEVFTQSRCLDAQLTHPRQSTAEKPFSCSLCGKGFTLCGRTRTTSGPRSTFAAS